jgi:DNA ligase (NAD+)
MPASDMSGRQPLLGKTFVLTGVLAGMSRDEAAARIQILGGTVTSAVSQKTSYLITGETPGTNKTDQAAKFNIPVLSEQEFLTLLGDPPAPRRKPVQKKNTHQQGELF